MEIKDWLEVEYLLIAGFIPDADAYLSYAASLYLQELGDNPNLPEKDPKVQQAWDFYRETLEKIEKETKRLKEELGKV